jgi:hypothetical protein
MIEFAEALAELQGMIDEEVLVTLTLGDCFFGGAFRSRLCRVESMPPDDVAVVLRFEHGEAVQLDPDELEAYLGGRDDGPPRWLQLQVLLGPTVTMEIVDDSAE